MYIVNELPYVNVHYFKFSHYIIKYIFVNFMFCDHIQKQSNSYIFSETRQNKTVNNKNQKKPSPITGQNIYVAPN